MKNSLLTMVILLFTSVLLSNTSYAQRDAGGTASGSGSGSGTGGGTSECIIQPPPTAFKRNNGDGTCGQNGQIRLEFGEVPTVPPTLVSLMYEDGTPVTNILLPVEGQGDLAHKKYLSYCLIGGNISPAKKLIAVFHYAGGCQEDTMLYEQ